MAIVTVRASIMLCKAKCYCVGSLVPEQNIDAQETA